MKRLAPLHAKNLTRLLSVANEQRNIDRGCPFGMSIYEIWDWLTKEVKELRDEIGDPTRANLERVKLETADLWNISGWIPYKIELIQSGHVCDKQCSTCKVTHDGIL